MLARVNDGRMRVAMASACLVIAACEPSAPRSPDGAATRPDDATDATTSMDAATTRPFVFTGPTIALQTPDGAYVAASAGGGGAVHANGTALGPDTIFKVVDVDAGQRRGTRCTSAPARQASWPRRRTPARARPSRCSTSAAGSPCCGPATVTSSASPQAVCSTRRARRWTRLRVVDGGPARTLRVAAVTDLGAMGHPPAVTGRDDGLSVRVGDNVAWLFGDSLLTVTTADTGVHLRSSTGGWGRATGNILPLVEALDAHGAPLELLPFSAAEAAFNGAHTDGTRYAHGASGVIERDGEALIFYAQLIVHPGALDYQGLGTGVAHLRAGATVATLDPALLFPASAGALYGEVHYVEGRYACGVACAITGTLSASCTLGRVPVAMAEQRAAWVFWNGAAWVPGATHAARVIDGVGSSGTSIAWCPYLRQYLVVYSPIFSDTLAARAAPSMQGPWSDPVTLATIAGVTDTNYAGHEHPELRSADGATLVVSYAHPTGTFTEDLRVAHVTLHRSGGPDQRPTQCGGLLEPGGVFTISTHLRRSRSCLGGPQHSRVPFPRAGRRAPSSTQRACDFDRSARARCPLRSKPLTQPRPSRKEFA